MAISHTQQKWDAKLSGNLSYLLLDRKSLIGISLNYNKTINTDRNKKIRFESWRMIFKTELCPVESTRFIIDKNYIIETISLIFISYTIFQWLFSQHNNKIPTPIYKWLIIIKYPIYQWLNSKNLQIMIYFTDINFTHNFSETVFSVQL